MSPGEIGPQLEPDGKEKLPPLIKPVDLRAGWARSYLRKNKIDSDQFIKKVTAFGIWLDKAALEKDVLGSNHENINLAHAIARIQEEEGSGVDYDGMLGDKTMLALDHLYAREIEGEEASVKRETLSQEVLTNAEELTPEAMRQAVQKAKEKGEILVEPKRTTLIGGSLLNGGGVVDSLPSGVNELGWNGASTKAILTEMRRLDGAGLLSAKIEGCSLLLDAGIGNDLMAGRSAVDVMVDVKAILELCERNNPRKIILMTRPPYNLDVLIPVLERTNSPEEAQTKAKTMQKENTKLAEAFRLLASEKAYDFIDANRFTSSNLPTEGTYGVHPEGRVFYDYAAMQLTAIANNERLVV